MAGSQVAWNIELGYGTPFLLTLGVSEQLTSLVWLAGPIRGLIAQPLIGAISDSSTSRYRRRYWIALSTFVLVLSTLTLAYCQDIADFVVDLFGVGVGDWDLKRKRLAANTAIGIAVVQFYLLDFALNALQASLRNLLLDITPSSQLNAGNAWHGRMTHLGNILGYGKAKPNAAHYARTSLPSMCARLLPSSSDPPLFNQSRLSRQRAGDCLLLCPHLNEVTFAAQ